jgi:hypothetical protein
MSNPYQYNSLKKNNFSTQLSGLRRPAASQTLAPLSTPDRTSALGATLTTPDEYTNAPAPTTLASSGGSGAASGSLPFLAPEGTKGAELVNRSSLPINNPDYQLPYYTDPKSGQSYTSWKPNAWSPPVYRPVQQEIPQEVINRWNNGYYGNPDNYNEAAFLAHKDDWKKWF